MDRKTVFAWVAAATLLASSPFAFGQTEAAKTNDFEFAGGMLKSFVREVNSQLGFNLRDKVEISNTTAETVRVPKMTMRKGDWYTLLIAYNSLSAQAGESLGRWVISSPEVLKTAHVEAIMFVPPPTKASATFKLRAFSIENLNEAERTLLIHTITRLMNRLNVYS